jgi:hypothetical protein
VAVDTASVLSRQPYAHIAAISQNLSKSQANLLAALLAEVAIANQMNNPLP